MVDNIVELEDNNKYVILEEQNLEEQVYYLGLKLDENENPTKDYLFFQEEKIGDDIALLPIEDENTKDILLTSFSADYINKAYEMSKCSNNE